MRFGEREIFRTRDLDVERIAGNDLHVIAVMCGQACFVGGVELLALGARERIAKNVEAKTLWRLGRHEIRSIDSRGQPSIARRVNRVCDRQGRYGAVMLARDFDQLRECVDSKKGRTASCTATTS